MSSRKFLITVSTGYTGCEHIDEIEIDEEHLEGLTEDEIESMVHEMAVDFMHERVEVGFEEIE